MSLYREARRRIRPPEQEESPRAQERFLALLRSSAGVDYAPNRDPVYALSEGFSQVFDLVGKQSALLLAGKKPDLAAGTSMRPLVEVGEQDSLRRFASYAFQSGRMAGAVRRGQGEMMLHACLRRAAGLRRRRRAAGWTAWPTSGPCRRARRASASAGTSTAPSP